MQHKNAFLYRDSANEGPAPGKGGGMLTESTASSKAQRSGRHIHKGPPFVDQGSGPYLGPLSPQTLVSEGELRVRGLGFSLTHIWVQGFRVLGLSGVFSCFVGFDRVFMGLYRLQGFHQPSISKPKTLYLDSPKPTQARKTLHCSSRVYTIPRTL